MEFSRNLHSILQNKHIFTNMIKRKAIVINVKKKYIEAFAVISVLSLAKRWRKKN